MLEIKNLHVKLAEEDKTIINGLSLTVPKGEVHAIMGPNGSGKSTLAYVIAGREDYVVTEGDILWNGESVLDMEPDERAAKGVFLAFQYPMEIPGVAGVTFLRTALNALRKKRGEAELTTPEFMKVVREKAGQLKFDMEMLKRPVNTGFSGGEKKRSEILQMAMLVITHYQRLLNYIVPDQVHVLAGGRIQKSGGKELAVELETSGYAEFAGKAA
jgi:Fe-S cluster assembly ATP-binding protein